ncbi:hypothetical protein [Cognatishimia maritima]|uniref:Uncharacterized protein n=1 Tax=Cognatishimia maritima TaxID=870908 RepID=A0A1M5KYG2_9RHOB|nr:hypothetical protein [Cognatishimia maritima]SHG57848.1 hypothetical protein SAMN04488044_1109 [Cognatishimia maritima]
MCKQRFLQSILKTSESPEVVLPWAKKRLNVSGKPVTLKPALPARKIA